ncbi:MAG: adenine phosphoribosyltransferase [Chlorobiaceae bacterium]|nr:adenine phosphoribosyltransferase [Chlorobiaceae bacterium]MBA4308781.1 adenine phosphoribosyltransferase [Chlorobiaceae bacterium]
MDLKNFIRNVPDFPKKGIMFRDITTLIKNPDAIKFVSNEICKVAKDLGITKVAGIESRGFIFGAIIAEKLNVGFVPIRKPNKLPSEKLTETYELEYGVDAIEIHKDAIEPGDKVLLHDDLLATGGTAKAACNLIEKLGGEIKLVSFLVELSFINGRTKLSKYNIHSLVDYDSE